LTTDEQNRRATEYVDRIIKINKSHGGAVVLTAEERRRTIAAAVAAFSGLRPRTEG
jgi:hypothetical protein